MSWTSPSYVVGYTASYTSAISGYTATYALGITYVGATWIAYVNGQPVINTPVNTALPVITGTERVGQTLSCSTGDWTSPTNITYSYLWLRDDVPIGGATSNTYVLVNADYNTQITCQVSATNNDGTAFVDADPVGPITDAAPVNTVAPVVSGSAIVGGTLSCTTGTWTYNQAPTYTYQWKRDGVDISAATASTYQLVTADNGKPMSCTVTATNDGGANSANGNTLTPPVNFSITGATAGDTTATVTWSAVTGATSYTLKRGTSAGSYTTTVTSVTSPYADSGLVNGTTYYYMIQAVNSEGTTNANAEVTATPTWSDVYGLDLGASNSTKYLSAGSVNFFSWASPFSLSVWIKPGNNPSDGLIFSKLNASSTGYDFRYNASNKFQWYSSPNAAGTRIQLQSASAYSQGSWYHVVLTFSGNQSATGFKLYINGSNVTFSTQINTSAADWTSAANTNIGTYNGGAGAFLRGVLDEMTLWNVELTSGNVTSLYNSGHPGNPVALSFWSSNTSYWRFGDVTDSATTIYDRGYVGGYNLTGVNLVSGDFTTSIP